MILPKDFVRMRFLVILLFARALPAEIVSHTHTKVILLSKKKNTTVAVIEIVYA